MASQRDSDPLANHDYNWPDLRELAIGNLGVGDVLFKPDAFEAYYTSTDGRVMGAFAAFNGLRGTAWKIVSKDGDTYTVIRHDGRFSQTFSRPPAWRTLAVKLKGDGDR